MKKEQSSILTPNNKLVGVKPTEREKPKLPKPTGWRLLVLPFKMKETTKGGLVLAETTLETTTSCFTSRISYGHGSTML